MVHCKDVIDHRSYTQLNCINNKNHVVIIIGYPCDLCINYVHFLRFLRTVFLQFSNVMKSVTHIFTPMKLSYAIFNSK